MSYLFTSEAVSNGHPDKVADQISDAILDEFIKKDKNSHVACETMVTTGLAMISGEVTAECYVDVQKVVRETVNSIGYNKPELQFAGDSIGVISAIHEQSPDIAMGVNKEDQKNQGAGDQGIMFGYAVKGNEQYMPLELYLSRRILIDLMDKSANEGLNLGPDAKSQVTVGYDNNHKPFAVKEVLVSVQHTEDRPLEDIYQIVNSVIADLNVSDDIKKLFKYNYTVLVNPTGKFVIGGPAGDTGLTGRKIVVDTYGGHCPHGGGAFSGKDPSKVDRSGAYMARYVAKNLVAAGVCDECTIQLSYAIGNKTPRSIFVDTHNTSHVELYDDEIADALLSLFDFTPYGIIEHLKLKAPIYRVASAWGPFGWNPYIDSDGNEYFTWEKLDKVDDIKKLFCI